MYTIIYFSPTGNTLHLAKKLASNLGENKVEILPLEFTDPKQLSKNDHLVLMHPIHGFNATRTVKRFVKNLPAGIYKKVSIISVGCNTMWLNDAVSSDLRKVLVKKNYQVVVDEVLAMPLTFVMSFPEDAVEKLFDESETRIEEISKALENNKKSEKDVLFKSKLMNFIGKVEDRAARMFGLELHATKDCNSCRLCWNICPEKNIKPNNKNKPKFGFKCMMCMRCIYSCPQEAITPYISKFMTIKGGYHIKK